MDSRRRFLAGLLAIPATLVMPRAAPPDPDRFVYHGYKVWWADWRSPANQDAVIGFWMAEIPRAMGGSQQHNRMYVSTFGSAGTAEDYHVLDMGAAPGWPCLTGAANASDRAIVKARAKAVLLKRLDG